MPDDPLTSLDDALAALARSASDAAVPASPVEVRRRGQARRTRRAAIVAAAGVVAVAAVGAATTGASRTAVQDDAAPPYAAAPVPTDTRTRADPRPATGTRADTRPATGTRADTRTGAGAGTGTGTRNGEPPTVEAGRSWRPTAPDGRFRCGAAPTGVQRQFVDDDGARVRQVAVRGQAARQRYRDIVAQLARCPGVDASRITSTQIKRVPQVDEGVVYAYRFADQPPVTLAVARDGDELVYVELTDDEPVSTALAASVVESALAPFEPAHDVPTSAPDPSGEPTTEPEPDESTASAWPPSSSTPTESPSRTATATPSAPPTSSPTSASPTSAPSASPRPTQTPPSDTTGLEPQPVPARTSDDGTEEPAGGTAPSEPAPVPPTP